MHEDFYQSQCLGEQKMLHKCLHRGSDTGIHMCTAQSLHYTHLAVIRSLLFVLVLLSISWRECCQLVTLLGVAKSQQGPGAGGTAPKGLCLCFRKSYRNVDLPLASQILLLMKLQQQLLQQQPSVFPGLWCWYNREVLL